MAKSIRYSDEYIEQCFAKWAGAGFCGVNALSNILEKDEHGRLPSQEKLAEWMNTVWVHRAQAIKLETQQKLDRELVTVRAEMLKRLAETAVEVQEMALDYIRTNGFDGSASAVQAFKVASQLERETRGGDVMLSRISEMSDDEVSKRLTQLLQGKKLPVVSEVVDGSVEEYVTDSSEESDDQ